MTRYLSTVDTVDTDTTRRHVRKTLYERRQRGFTSSRSAHQGDVLSRLNMQVDIV